MSSLIREDSKAEFLSMQAAVKIYTISPYC